MIPALIRFALHPREDKVIYYIDYDIMSLIHVIIQWSMDVYKYLIIEKICCGI